MRFEVLRTSRGHRSITNIVLKQTNVHLASLRWTYCRYSDLIVSETLLKSDLDQPQLLQVIARENQAEHTAGPSPYASVSAQGSLELASMDLPLSWELLDFPAASNSASMADTHIELFGQLTMDALMTKAFSNAVTAEDVSDTTTLCSWAFSLVLKNNSKGYSAEDLDLKLRVGYRHGATPTEGCRIDNKVLLNVLAEVT